MRCSAYSASSTLVALLAMTAAACNPGVFVDLEDDAPTISFNKPSGFGRDNFGATVAGIEGVLSNGAVATRLAVGGGTDTGTWTYGIWNADSVGTFRVATKQCELPADDCVTGTGATLVGIPEYANESVCVLIGEPAADQVRVRCETNTTMPRAPTGVGITADENFGAAAAAIPSERVADVGGVAIVGAPSAGSGLGTLYRLPMDGSAPIVIDEIAATRDVLGPNAGLGREVAVAALPDTNALYTVARPVLVAATAGGMNRVVVAAVGADPNDSTQIIGEVLGCLDGVGGFGGALAAGDIDGDGLPEVYVGYAEGAMAHPDELTMLDLADISAPLAGCTDVSDADDPTTTTLACPSIDGETCDTSHFGASLALGDLDADGITDLIVGAPRHSVDGHADAGAVFAMAGSATGVDPGRSTMMRISHPSTNDRLGASVAVVRTHLGLTGISERHEVAAGAPGAEAAYVFLCSGLGDDLPTAGDRCLELPAN